jgi:hypothetical protein
VCTSAAHLHHQVDALPQRDSLPTGQAQGAVVIQHWVQGLNPHVVNRAVKHLVEMKRCTVLTALRSAFCVVVELEQLSSNELDFLPS